MKITVCENADVFDRTAALYIISQVLKKPDSTLCLATGNTTLNMYAQTADLQKKLAVDFSCCKTCNLDEYAALAADDPKSCRYRINEILLQKINIKMENTYVPNGLTVPPEKELNAFAEKIDAFGGIDLAVLSIGSNGHIAFNEPGTSFDSDFRIAPISDNTKKDKAVMFGGQDKVPKFGITMGIRNIMMSREILLVAKGKSKAEIIKSIVNGPLTTDVPATVVRLHPNLTVLADKDAASLLG